MKSQKPPLHQPDLFRSVLGVYSRADSPLTNSSLYGSLVDAGAISEEQLHTKHAIGAAGQLHSPVKRKIRWIQQTLKALGAIERTDDRRGMWQVATHTKNLDKAPPNTALLAFSTHLGLALWADCSVLKSIHEPISLILTSPPYPLRKARAYGNPSAKEFTDFICTSIEPLLASLLPGGSVCLNLSNDIFEQHSPARNTYLERLTIALEDRLGLHLMDRLVWENPSKPPGPTYWACRSRQQLVHTWEPVLWFTNDPLACFADNRRVLRPHSSQQQALIARGGENRNAQYGDGAYRLCEGDFGNQTAGAIPRNILRFPHEAMAIAPARQLAQGQGLPVHSALMPVALAKFLIEFTTPTPTPNEPEDAPLVVDPFGGWLTTARAAETTGRRWICTEQVGQYLAGAANRFEGAEGFERFCAVA
jgi:site-specific DNA-methyltransferase (cytosine-N4-specific)